MTYGPFMAPTAGKRFPLVVLLYLDAVWVRPSQLPCVNESVTWGSCKKAD